MRDGPLFSPRRAADIAHGRARTLACYPPQVSARRRPRVPEGRFRRHAHRCLGYFRAQRGDFAKGVRTSEDMVRAGPARMTRSPGTRPCRGCKRSGTPSLASRASPSSRTPTRPRCPCADLVLVGVSALDVGDEETLSPKRPLLSQPFRRRCGAKAGPPFSLRSV